MEGPYHTQRRHPEVLVVFGEPRRTRDGCMRPSFEARRSAHLRMTAVVAATATQFAAKQYISPSPPVLFRSFCEQPPSGPREECDEFHDLEASSSRSPIRSEWPTVAAPCVLLVQFLQVRSSRSTNAVPSGCDPVSTS